MQYINLLSGVTLLGVFTWILIRNSKRSGFMHTLFRFDTILGIAAGLYLVFSSIHSLWVR